MIVKKCLNILIGKKNITLETNDKDKKEFDLLKKYNRKLKSLKIIAIILALFLIFAWSFKGIECIYRYYNGKYAYEIISKVYESTKNLKDQDNFYLSSKNSFAQYNLYYKDKKFKLVSNYYGNGQGSNIYYGKIIGDTTLWFDIYDKNGKSINGSVAQFEFSHLAIPFENVFYLLSELNEKSLVELGKIKVSEETRYGKEYYILRDFSNNEGFVLEIDKQTMLVTKCINLSDNGTDNCTHYGYSPGVVRDIKLEIENLDEYTMDEELKPYIYNF